MKIRLMSDLHTEFGSPRFITDPPVLVDDKDTVLLLPGDIGLGLDGIRYANRLAPRFKAVCIIFGNHEYYNNEFLLLPDEAQNAITEGNVHFLHRGVVQIDNFLFIGATLWTGFSNNSPLVRLDAQRSMSDYDVIKYMDRKLRPEDIYVEHQKDKAHLESAIHMAEQMNNKAIVLTHHLPADQCIHPMYQKSWFHRALNPMYSAAMDEDVFRWSETVALWVFGHSHISTDLMIGGCRMVSNPYGYYGEEENPTFNPSLVLEV